MYSSYDLENLAREQYARLVREAEEVRLARRALADKRRRGASRAQRLASLLTLDRLRAALRDRRLDAPLEVSVEDAR